MNTAPLTPTERQIATLLARSKTQAHICTELSITIGTLRVHMSHIRGKTGIATLDPAMLAEHLESTNQGKKKKINLTLTDAQRSVLEMVSIGWKHGQIAWKLGISVGTATNHASQGYKRLGITATGTARRVALLAALRPMTHPGKPDLSAF